MYISPLKLHTKSTSELEARNLTLLVAFGRSGARFRGLLTRLFHVTTKLAPSPGERWRSLIPSEAVACSC